MFIRFSALLPIAALAAVAAAAPTALEARGGQCNTGGNYCCKSTQSATDPSVTKLAGLLGVVLGSVDALVGLTCSPIGVSGNSCTQEPVCCTGNSYDGGVLVLGCSPVNANL